MNTQAVNKNELLVSVTTWINLKVIMLKEARFPTYTLYTEFNSGWKTLPSIISKQRMLLPSSQQLQLPTSSVHPEGIQDKEKEDTGPRQLRCI